MHLFRDFLPKMPFLVLDGALATELERKGADLNDPLWSAKTLLEQPELIQATHLEYLLAGADILTTATYQATFQGFKQKVLSTTAAEQAFSRAVQLANNASDLYRKTQRTARPVLVAASIGPYGAYLADGSEYSGQYGLSPGELVEFHRHRLAFLARQNVDLIIFETIPSLAEIEAIVRLLDENDLSLPVLLSVNCKDHERLADGHPLRDAVKLASQSPHIQAIGANCVQPHLLTNILSNFSRHTTLPLLAYPNNGDLWDAEKKCWIVRHSAFDEKTNWKSWLQSGAKIIGGCCRSTPEQTKRLVNFRNELMKKRSQFHPG